MTKHPYAAMPDFVFWSRSIARPPQDEVDPVVEGKFKIGRLDKVATAGSCFAQHIATRLSAAGFNYFVAETVNPIVEDASGYNYGTYSARYGNLYTARQLLQLCHRAYGLFQPSEDIWPTDDGKFKDPFRPEIQPGGFSTKTEFYLDRSQHLAAVRRMIEDMDVFVFTLGLTEAWVSSADGAVFPLCPGVSGGQFSPSDHTFVNFGLDEVIVDLEAAFSFIRSKNSRVRFIITVSPIPLAATAVNRSVLVSTTLSKSVLRLAAERIHTQYNDTAYFPSYEIITGPQARGRYFDKNLRSVTQDGISHVMKMFIRHYTDEQSAANPIEVANKAPDNIHDAIRDAAALICEETMLDA